MGVDPEFASAYFQLPSPQALTEVFKITSSGLVQEVYTGVCMLPAESVRGTLSQAELLKKLEAAVTPSLMAVIARIFACYVADNPLLLVGAPGLGKTFGITIVSRLLGYEVERINCAASTTLDQLFGCIVPTVSSTGRRSFEVCWFSGV